MNATSRNPAARQRSSIVETSTGRARRNRGRRASAAAAAGCMLETLEDRQLMALTIPDPIIVELAPRATYSLLTQSLGVNGNSQADNISIRVTAGVLTVTDNNVQLWSGAAASVTRINVTAGDGNDIVNAVGVAIPLSVSAGAGNDSVSGGTLNDTLDGGDGADSMNGDAGNDSITGGIGNDTLDGNVGNDSIYGQDGDDLLYGWTGADYINGGAGNDRAYGEADNDTVDGDTGNDSVYGQDGDDLLYGWTGADLVDGGNGNDRVHGEADNDTLIGGAGNNSLYGGAGNDSLTAGTGADSLYGDAGNDTLDGGTGADYLSGGLDYDTLNYTTRTAALNISINNAADDGQAGEADNVRGDVERINGGSGHDVMTAAGASTSHRFFGMAGNDTLIGGSGDDVLEGGDGNDSMSSGAGFDTLRGLAGNDSMHGGGGIDIMLGGVGDDFIWGDDGADNLLGEEGQDRLFAGTGASDDGDTLYGGPDNDILVSIGGGQHDLVSGEGGFDSFWVDVENTEWTDADHDEARGRNVHRVAGFYNCRRNGVNLGAPSRELNGVNLAEPIGTVTNLDANGNPVTFGAGGFRNFSDRPLFAAAGPAEGDIDQGSVGDCYYLATLAATARTNGHKIVQSVVDLGDGTYAVRFDRGGVQHFIRVDADLPVEPGGAISYAGLGVGDSLWVAIMEKAWAFFRQDQGTYQSIDAGWMSEAFSALGVGSTDLGRPSWFEEIFDSLTSQELLGYIHGELMAGKAVTLGTIDPDDIPAGNPLVGLHAYSVDHVNFDANGNAVSLRVRNPWGGAGDPAAFLTITAAEARAAFSKITSAWVSA